MKTISELMTTKLLTIGHDKTMKNVHDLITRKGIRHIPIVDASNSVMVGLVTHKNMISKVVSLLTLHGPDRLVEQEMKTSVMDIAVTDFQKINQNQSLKDAAEFFLNNKHGCLPVFDDDDHLVGMLSSSDFVKLSLSLLSK